MKKLFTVLICILGLLAVLLLTAVALGISGAFPQFGFSNTSTALELTNRQVFTPESYKSIQMKYSHENITILPSPTNEIVLEEYMNRSDDNKKANISQSPQQLTIQQGSRSWSGFFNTFRAKILIYIPESWMGKFSINGSSGDITFDGDFTFKELSVLVNSGTIKTNTITTAGPIKLSTSSGDVSAQSLVSRDAVVLTSNSGSLRSKSLTAISIEAAATSGDISIDTATAKNIQARSSSGGIRFGSLDGEFSLKSTSGGIHLAGGSGSGTAQTSSGGINIGLFNADGNITLNSTSGNVKITLPRSLSFYFEANTTSGDISTPSDVSVSYNKRGNEATGSFGERPESKLHFKTSSGNITLTLG